MTFTVEHLGPDVTLYCGDALEVLPTLEAGSVDVVVTSPPYNVGLPYTGYDDKLAPDDFLLMNAQWLTECFRIASSPSRLYTVVSNEMVFFLRPLAEKAGWTFAQLLVWCKPNLAGGAGKITGDWNNSIEPILLFRKGKRTPMLSANVNTHSYFVLPSPQRNWNTDVKEHVAQWPVRLPLVLLARTPGSRVIDPFMGSGAGGVACVKLGRSFLGIEISQTDYNIACKRISDAQLQMRLL